MRPFAKVVIGGLLSLSLIGTLANADDREKATNPEQVSYEEAFRDLYQTLGREYPCFSLKAIDWTAVGKELLPRAKEVETDEQFGLLCLELVARLEDSHAFVSKGTRNPPANTLSPLGSRIGLSDRRSRKAGGVLRRPGRTGRSGGSPNRYDAIVSINGTSASEAIRQCMRQTAKYSGYSSQRYLGYQAARWCVRQTDKGSTVTLGAESPDGHARTFKLSATKGIRYLPRLPVPIPAIADSGNVGWTRLEGNIGYIYVRRIRGDLIEKLDLAVKNLEDVKGMIVDVRGNSGGGFDSSRAHRNFTLDDTEEPQRPRFKGPMALLFDARCISAGEGWASWFVARDRARSFGQTTAGASSRKRRYVLKNGFYTATFSVKAYRGFLDRPIERRGLEPDEPVVQNAKDLAAGRDTVLEAARSHLLKTP